MVKTDFEISVRDVSLMEIARLTRKSERMPKRIEFHKLQATKRIAEVIKNEAVKAASFRPQQPFKGRLLNMIKSGFTVFALSEGLLRFELKWPASIPYFEFQEFGFRRHFVARKKVPLIEEWAAARGVPLQKGLFGDFGIWVSKPRNLNGYIIGRAMFKGSTVINKMFDEELKRLGKFWSLG